MFVNEIIRKYFYSIYTYLLRINGAKMNNGTKKMLPFHFHQYCYNGREAEIIFWEVRQDGSVSFLHQTPRPPLSLSLSLHVFA